MARITFLAALAAVSWLAPINSQGPLFAPAPGSPVKVGPGSGQIVLADLNRDGHLDMVTRHLRDRSVAILAGDGKGGFAHAPRSPIRFTYEPGTIALGDGHGAFARTAASRLSLDSGGHIVALADVSGDGRRDTVLRHGESVSVLENRGNGTFAPQSTTYDVGRPTYAVAVADVNADRRPDLIAATVDSVTVLLREGAAFRHSAATRFPAGPGAYNLAVGDINNDGRIDVVASSFASDSVTVLLGQ